MTEPVEEFDWTVSAFWHETLERFTLWVSAPTADYAEQLAHLEAKERGGHLGVAGVFPGHLTDNSSALWLDPSCKTQEQMNAIRSESGWWA